MDEKCRNCNEQEKCIPFFDHPGSLERIAEECDVDVSTVKRTINRNSYIYKYLPETDPKMNRK